MARISGVDLPKNKRGVIALTYIFGVGRTTAEKILSSAGIDLNTKVKDWNDGDVNGIIKYIAEHLKLEGELRGEIQQNIKRLQDIGAYRGVRHRKGLPLRGQRTKTNAGLERVNVRQLQTKKWLLNNK